MTVLNYKKCREGDLIADFATDLTPARAEALANAGFSGVMQYTPYTVEDRFKYGSAREAQIAFDFGMYYMLNWEIEANRSLQGYQVGRSDGARNRAACRAMGYPEQVSAPVSVDMNTFAANFYVVHDFCRGHWETDGDLADINFGYIDTDGGRALADLSPALWIPGAFSWSPELFAIRKNTAQLLEVASANPQAYCIQFPSEAFYNFRIDRNIVLKPFNVWCAPYEVVQENTEDIKPPPFVAPDDAYQGENMIIRNRDTGWVATLSGGYLNGGTDDDWNGAPPSMRLEVSNTTWAGLEAISDHQKTRDAAQSVAPAAGGGGTTVVQGPKTSTTTFGY